LKLINGNLSDVAAIDSDSQHCAGGQIDAVDKHFKTTTIAILQTILGSPARRHPVDGCAREGCVEPCVITEHPHKTTQRVGGHGGPDDRTYQRRQKNAKPAISVKVT
jgi:hypothetical protein